MTAMLLVKQGLPAGWIDAAIGEPYIVRDILLKTFNLDSSVSMQPEEYWEYPAPNGLKNLVAYLENKHQAPVIITNGAKQGLAACFYALRRMNKTNIGMRCPYWALIPPLMQLHGVGFPLEEKNAGRKEDAMLYVVPNNPDGYAFNSTELRSLYEMFKEASIPMIHDAAYYTHTYLPFNYELVQFGDVQIYSISKMFGLSGLRIGYCVCPNTEMYNHILQYMEAMTVGVSVVSQSLLFDLFTEMDTNPDGVKSFEHLSAQAIADNKRIIKQVHPDILMIDPKIEKIPGMFGWFKLGPKANLNKSKIQLIDGGLFGMPGYVRMNLAFDNNQMTEIVERLNSVIL